MSDDVPKVRLASTVMLLRDASGGLEVFMVQRHRRAGFLPQAWVFPGGRVDPGDRGLVGHPRVHGGEQLSDRFAVPLDQAVAHAVAGIRETFEEAGVWLGSGRLPEALRGPLNDGEVALADALAEHDATLPLDGLAAWSWWVTPEAEPKRYDTRFLAVALPPDSAPVHDDLEVVDSRWVCPRAVLEAGDQAGFPLAPPTWWTLRELAAYPDVASALASERVPSLPIQPTMSFVEEGVDLELPPIPGLPQRIRFHGGTWVAFLDDEPLPRLPG